MTRPSCRRNVAAAPTRRARHIGHIHGKPPIRMGLPRRRPTCYATAMIDSILGWISGGRADGSGRSRPDELQLALTALLVEAAHSDDRFDESQRCVIAQPL